MLDSKLKAQKEKGLWRQLCALDKSLINFASNDYLCISSHSKVKQALIEYATEYGFGSGSSTLICGYTKLHEKFEKDFAEFVERDRAILLNSGYHANLAAITLLANKDTCILSDKLCHASIIDGIALSKAKLCRFRHNDVSHAKSLFKSNALLITESVFSMEGDIAPVQELATLSSGNIIVDDAHGFGILGKNGRGVVEHADNIKCLITPLGKALGGLGGVISGSTDLIEAVIQFSRTYKYTTALPPSVVGALIAALEVLKTESWRRHKLIELCNFFIEQCRILSIPLISDAITPIMSIIIGENNKALLLKEKLRVLGLLVSCIRVPTISKGSERLRISLNCSHDEKSISRLLEGIAKNAKF